MFFVVYLSFFGNKLSWALIRVNFLLKYNEHRIWRFVTYAVVQSVVKFTKIHKGAAWDLRPTAAEPVLYKSYFGSCVLGIHLCSFRAGTRDNVPFLMGMTRDRHFAAVCREHQLCFFWLYRVPACPYPVHYPLLPCAGNSSPFPTGFHLLQFLVVASKWAMLFVHCIGTLFVYVQRSCGQGVRKLIKITVKFDDNFISCDPEILQTSLRMAG
jgi:hypothetical protein